MCTMRRKQEREKVAEKDEGPNLPLLQWALATRRRSGTSIKAGVSGILMVTGGFLKQEGKDRHPVKMSLVRLSDHTWERAFKPRGQN